MLVASLVGDHLLLRDLGPYDHLAIAHYMHVLLYNITKQMFTCKFLADFCKRAK
jgi:hypothetical protein